MQTKEKMEKVTEKDMLIRKLKRADAQDTLNGGLAVKKQLSLVYRKNKPCKRMKRFVSTAEING